MIACTPEGFFFKSGESIHHGRQREDMLEDGKHKNFIVHRSTHEEEEEEEDEITSSWNFFFGRFHPTKSQTML